MEELKVTRVFFVCFFPKCVFLKIVFFPSSVFVVRSVWAALAVSVCVRVTHPLLTGADDLSSVEGLIKRVRVSGANERMSVIFRRHKQKSSICQLRLV